MTVTAETMKVERQDEVTKILNLNRPEFANALNMALVREITDEVITSYSDATKLLIVKGQGRHFCSGFDLEVAESERNLLGVAVEALLQLLADAPFVTVARVQGSAVGGGADIAAACDYLCADDTAKFSFPGFRLIGVSLGNSRLARRIGPDQAMRMVLEARRVESAEALRMGLATDLCDDQKFGDFVAEMQGALATMPRETLRMLKQSVRRSNGFALRTNSQGHEGITAP